MAAAWMLAASPVDAALRPSRPDPGSRTPSRCDDTTCDAAESPLCGTNGQTYANYCLYSVASCKNASLAIAYAVACQVDVRGDKENGEGGANGGNSGPAATAKPTKKPPVVATKAPALVQEHPAFVLPITNNNKDQEAQALDFCAVKCTSTEHFVCGSDGQTYTNECLVLAAKCTNPKLQVTISGKCLTDKCAMFCTREYEPICGSDGVTYGNACTFAQASCLAQGALTAVTGGECPTPAQKPQYDGKKAGMCGAVQCEAMEVCIDDKANDRQFCAELCGDDEEDDEELKKHCEKHELCVMEQVACFVAPCPKQPRCIKMYK